MGVTTIVRAAEAPLFELPGVKFTGLAAPSRGSHQVCTWRLAVEPRLDPGPPHRLDRDEVFMVLSGAVQITPDGALVKAGDAVTVPAGELIALANPSDEPAEVYVAIPAGFTATMADGTSIGTPPWAQ
jgi:mannose-6-phosphate isomerase-like protein (cupin superfamily)